MPDIPYVSVACSVSTGSSVIQTPEVLLAGVPASFVEPSLLDFTTFRGCLHDFTYNTSEGSPILINPVDSTDNQCVITTAHITKCTYVLHIKCWETSQYFRLVLQDELVGCIVLSMLHFCLFEDNSYSCCTGLS